MSITVTGFGEASGPPDSVEIEVGVSVLADTVADATSTAAGAAQSVVSALESAGIGGPDVTTAEYALRPEYDYSGNQQRMTGYRVVNTLRAKIRDVTAVGDIVDSVSQAAGDHATINGLRFGVENDAGLQAAAREAAWNDAMTKATHLAALSGQTLGTATSITDTVRGPVVPMRMMADMALAKEAGTPIQPGASTVSVNLVVEFSTRV